MAVKKILSVKVSDLTLDPNNARKHGEKDLAAIVASLDKFEQQTPIVITSDNVVIKGNGTVMAAMKLNWTHVEAIRTNLTGQQVTAYAIADNRTSDLSEFDNEKLLELLQGLDEQSLIDACGFDAEAMAELLKEVEDLQPVPEIVEDEVPELPVEPITKPGDIWILGEHRVMCGDSTVAIEVQKLMDGDVADACLTDPPYGVSYVGKTKDALIVENDDMDEEQLCGLVLAAFDNAQAVCRPGAYWYATVPPGPLHLVFAEDWKCRGILRQIMVWAKDSMVLGHSEYHYRHEPILFGWVPGGDRHKNRDRTRTTLWEYERPKASREHPTMKPVGLWSQAIADGSRKGECVYDPFLGSGTTVIAAEQLGRKCFGMEISPAYCDVIVARWEALTGKKATLQTASE